MIFTMVVCILLYLPPAPHWSLNISECYTPYLYHLLKISILSRERVNQRVVLLFLFIMEQRYSVGCIRYVPFIL